MSEKIRQRFYVSGRVQGVGYRLFVRDHALDMGVTGYARNLPDGRVEVVAEGPKSILKALLKRLEVGPSMARVDQVRVVDDGESPTFNRFSIR